MLDGQSIKALIHHAGLKDLRMGLHDKITVEITPWDLFFLIHATTPWQSQQHALSDRHRHKVIALLADEQDALARKAERKMAEVETRMRHLKRINAYLLDACRPSGE